MKTIDVTLHPAGYALADSNFNSLSVLDGYVYYTLSSHDIDHHGRVFRYDPAANKTEFLCDLGDATGDASKKAIPHGKSHSPFYRVGDRIIFATHYGFYQGNDGKEEPAPPPEGYVPYPGGKLLSLDPETGRCEVLAAAPPEEGIITMNMDVARGRVFCLTWPRAYFLVFDLHTGEMKNLGQHSRGGELFLHLPHVRDRPARRRRLLHQRRR